MMQRVDQWVAVHVRTDNRRSRYFLTWGRIQDPVDPGPLEELAVRAAAHFAIGGTPVSARVCSSLQEAAKEPYFFEALLTFAQQPVPRGAAYDAWREERAQAMAEGREFYFLGAR